MFAALLLARGYRVACITPDPAALSIVLSTHGVLPHDDLCLLPMPEIIPPPPTLRQRLRNLRDRLFRSSHRMQDSAEENTVIVSDEWRPTLRDRWRLNAHRYARNAPEVRVTPDLPGSIRLKRRVLHVVVPPAWYLLQYSRRLLCKLRCPAYHTGSQYPANLAAAADAALSGLRWKPDFLFSMYIDLWMTNPACWRPSRVRMPLPWGGIRFMPLDDRYAGTEGYFSDPMFRGLCFLDEEALGRYQARHPKRTFGFIPDVANGELPNRPGSLAEEIRCRALGRPIVLLCGSIEGRKNLRLFCETALRPEAGSFFFAIVGQLHPATISRDEQDLLDRFSASEAGNTFFQDVFFDDERDMNTVIRGADVIYAVYRDFPLSSNLLSKAAMFGKPVVASDRFLMGCRVRQYGIGLTVPEEGSDALAAALVALVENPVPKENFSRFCELFSTPEMARRLDIFLKTCMSSN